MVSALRLANTNACSSSASRAAPRSRLARSSSLRTSALRTFARIQGDNSSTNTASPAENLFAHGMWQHILGIGLLIGGLCLGVQAWALSTGHAHWQTMVFTVLTLGQMAHVLAIRSERDPLWQIGIASNRPLLGAVLLTFALQMATIYVPALNPVFKTQPLSLVELAICLGVSSIVYIAVEIEKYWRRNSRNSL